jgi:hypothetical protein
MSVDYFLALSDHYKAVRSRLNAGPPPPWRQPVLPAPEPEPAPPPPAPVVTLPAQTAKAIAREALAPHGLTWADAMGPSRTLPYTRARADVYAALRKHGWSLKKIALFCGRDHTTVMNALQPKKERTK